MASSLASGLRATDELDPVLAAARRAPRVETTEEELALLAELDGVPARWTPHAEFMARLPLAGRT
jgi:hypothetical protein